MENWMVVVTILVPVLGAFGYLMKKMDRGFERINDELKEIRKEIAHLDARISNIEGQITQMTRPQIIPLEKPEDLKEN